jgi:hypothetical protein
MEKGGRKNEEKLFFKTPKGIEFRYLTLFRAHKKCAFAI